MHKLWTWLCALCDYKKKRLQCGLVVNCIVVLRVEIATGECSIHLSREINHNIAPESYKFTLFFNPCAFLQVPTFCIKCVQPGTLSNTHIISRAARRKSSIVDPIWPSV
jgi:hypothetical protein